jgi:hypothetical protein
VFAEIDPAHRDLARIEPGGAEPRVLPRAINLDRARKRLHRQDRQSGGEGVGVDHIGIVGLEHQPVEPEREGRQFRPARAALAEPKQFQVIGPEHREVVHRAERVMAARRQLEAERSEGARSLVHAVADIDDDVIENGRGQRHGRPPALRCDAPP